MNKAPREPRAGIIRVDKNKTTSNRANAQAPRAQLTKLTANFPVSKRFLLNADGSLKKVAPKFAADWQVTRLSVTPTEFINELKSAGSNVVHAYGVPINDAATHMTSKKKYDVDAMGHDVTTRTADAFRWAAGAAVLTIDHDPGPTMFAPQHLLNAFYAVIPALTRCAHVWMPSVSSNIRDKRKNLELRGIEGQRIYIFVIDGTDIPRASKALYKRTWLHNHGYFKISKSGDLLERSILDGSIYQTNHVDFCGAAQCDEGLKQIKVPATLFGDESVFLDTRAHIPELSATEERSFESLVAASKIAQQPAARTVREAYQVSRVAELIESRVDPTRAAKIVADALDQHHLGSDFILTQEDGTVVTVNDLMSDPHKYHGMKFADPLEPTYRDDPRIAMALLKGPIPIINSFAHGGRVYRLVGARPLIRLVEGERYRYSMTIIEEFAKRGVFYNHANRIVSVNARFEPVHQTDMLMLSALDKHFEFETQRAKNVVRTDPPKQLAQQLLGGHPDSFLEVDAFVTAPIMVPSTGRMIEKQGYDEETKLLVNITEEYSAVPENPTLGDVEQSLRQIAVPLREFPFVGAVDASVVLASLLTTVMRPLLPTAPGFAFTAPVQGSGKTMLMMVVLAVGGLPLAMSTQPDARTDEEMRKRLFALLLSGQKAVIFDNVVHDFDSPALASMLSSGSITDRKLGGSETPTVQARVVTLISGNNFVLTGDLPRRFLTCHIDARVERPHERRFHFDPLGMIAESRWKFVRAALILMKAHFHSGFPVALSGSGISDEWNSCVRGTVRWLAHLLDRKQITADDTVFASLCDPTESMREALEDDPDRVRLGGLLQALEGTFGSGPSSIFMAKTLAGIGNGLIAEPASVALGVTETLRETLRDIAPGRGGLAGVSGVNPRALGRYFSSHKDRIADGRRLRSNGTYQGARTWYVESVAVSAPTPAVGDFGESGESLPTKEKVSTAIAINKKQKHNLRDSPNPPCQREA